MRSIRSLEPEDHLGFKPGTCCSYPCRWGISVAYTRPRSLYAYSLHGRSDDEVLDYDAFFAALSEADVLERQTAVGDETVALTAVERRSGNRWALRFVSGREGLPPLFYDPVSGTESTADLGSSFVATASWVFLDASTRIVIAERTRPGVSIGAIARALSHLGRELGIAPRLVIDLNPVASPGFLAELDRFDRIRQAAVVLTRPNYNWSDSSTELSGYADESNAGTVDVTMSAGRGQSLARNEGIVADIKSLTSKLVGPIKNLRITGTRTGESKETSVSLAKHQEKRFVTVDEGGSAAAIRDTLESMAMNFLNELHDADDSETSG